MTVDLYVELLIRLIKENFLIRFNYKNLYLKRIKTGQIKVTISYSKNVLFDLVYYELIMLLFHSNWEIHLIALKQNNVKYPTMCSTNLA